MLLLIPLMILVPALMFRAHIFHFPFGPATIVTPADAALHIGQYVDVRGTVAAVVRTSSGTTFLDFGASYPNEDFTAVLVHGVGAAAAPLGVYRGAKVSVTGRITLYRGRPEIVVRSVRQLAEAG